MALLKQEASIQVPKQEQPAKEERLSVFLLLWVVSAGQAVARSHPRRLISQLGLF